MVQQLEVNPASIRQQQEALAANPAAVLPPLAPAGGPMADLPSDQAALVWIQYMRFSRRSESVTASRKVRSRIHTTCVVVKRCRLTLRPVCKSRAGSAVLVLCSRCDLRRELCCVCLAAQMFIRAKKAPRCPWQVFVASALMEWRHAREKDVARKIFEKGLEVAEFATVPEYVLAYAAFLCGKCPGH